jgi:hypothetical protein
MKRAILAATLFSLWSSAAHALDTLPMICGMMKTAAETGARARMEKLTSPQLNELIYSMFARHFNRPDDADPYFLVADTYYSRDLTPDASANDFIKTHPACHQDQGG